MCNIEKILENINNIIGTGENNNINKTKIPLFIKIFEKFREDLDITSTENERLKKEKLQILENIENTFNKKEKELFEKYWKIENEINTTNEKNIFLFGYLLKNELDIENKTN